MEDIRRGAAVAAEPETPANQQSGRVFRPINDIARQAIPSDAAETPLERYKVSLRRYAPVQKGLDGLPWSGEWHCARCGENAPGKLLHFTNISLSISVSNPQIDPGSFVDFRR